MFTKQVMGRVTLSEQWRKKYEYHKFKVYVLGTSFKSEKLEIDYITLNISMKGEIESRVGRYLLVYGFNSTIQESEK
jgi:hypothetical protein